MTFSKKMINDYDIIDKIYGNYKSFQKRIIPLLQEKLIPKENYRILEIGCGTGITTEVILSINRNFSLESIDINNNMLKIASMRNFNKKVYFHKVDALEFLKSCEKDSFEFVVSGFTIHNFSREYRIRFYYELLRVLNKKGSFINADKYVSDDKNVAISSLKYRIDSYLNFLLPINRLGLLNEWISHYINDFKEEYRMTYEISLSEIKNTGFKNVHFHYKAEKEMLGILIAEK